jgi:hypothetical protein
MKESSAEDNKRNRRVEDVFREGFEDAQVPPAARLWDNLDQALENQELKHYRKQAFWYRSVAAACLLLLLTAGAFLWQQDQSLFGTGQGSLANAPSSTTTPSEQSASAKQDESLESAPEESTTGNSVFGSISGKQAKNEVASNAPSAKSGKELLSAPVEGRSTRLSGSTTDKVAANAPQRGRSSSVASSRRGEDRRDQLAVASITQNSGKAATGKEASRITGETITTLENALAKQPLTTSVASLATSNTSAVNTSDSLLNSRVATVLYQGDGNSLQMAKVEVAPSASAIQPDKKTMQKGWIVSLAYTPMYAYAPISVGEAPSRQGMKMSEEQQLMYEQYDLALEEYRDSYSPSYSYSAKVGAGYQINDHWQIESGFMYGHNEATTTHSFLITKASGMRINSLVPFVNKPEPIVKVAFEPELVNNLEAVTPTEQYQTRYKYQQIGVPLRIAYRKSISKVFAFVSGGVNLNLLLNNRIESDNPDVQAKRYHYKDEASPFRAWQWAAATSAGIGYQVNRKMSLMVAPELTYSFSSALKESQTQTDPYQVGVSIGGKYRLSK